MSGLDFPSNTSTSDLPSGLPPDGSSFLPKAEVIKASADHSTHEVEHSRGLGSKSQEWQYQKNQPGRYKLPGYGSISLLGRYKPPDTVPRNKNDGSKLFVLDYLGDHCRGQINGGQRFNNPRPALYGGWVPPVQDPGTATISSKSDIASTGKALRGHSTSTAVCFHCGGDDHETRNCEKASPSKQAQKRKLSQQKLCCCDVMDPCRHHAKKFPGLVTVTHEGRTCAEEPPISQWGTGRNAIAQGIERNVFFASTSMDINSKAGTSSQENIGIQTNASMSEESRTLTNERRIQESTNESVPGTTNTDEWNINSSQSSITGPDGFCGSEDTRNEMKDTEKSENNILVCNLCKRTEGRHEYGCLNSKKFRYLQNQPEKERKKHYKKVAQKKKRRLEYMSKTKPTMGIRKLFPDRRVEPLPSVTGTAQDEQQFLAYVDSIKRLSRKELERLVLTYMFSWKRNNQDRTNELDLAKQMARDFQERINVATYMQKGEKSKKDKLESRIECTIGTQTEWMTVPCQQKVPLTVHSLSPSCIKVEKVKASTSIEESSASNEESPDNHRSSVTIGNANAIQYDAFVRHNTITTAVKINRQGLPMPCVSLSQMENHVEPLEIRTSTTTDAFAGHPGKQLPPHAGPSHRSTEHLQSYEARPSTSTRNEISGFVEHQPPRSWQTDPLILTASIYGNQQRGRQNVQWDPRLMKLQTVKVETYVATGAPIQGIKIEAPGSRELPIQIE